MRKALVLSVMLVSSSASHGQNADLSDDSFELDDVGQLSGVCGPSSYITTLDDEERPVAHWDIDFFENQGVRRQNPSFKPEGIRKQRIQEVADNWRIKFEFDGMSHVSVETVDGPKLHWPARPWIQAGHAGFIVRKKKLGSAEFQKLWYRRWSETMVFSDIYPTTGIFGGVLGTRAFSGNDAAKHEILDCITLDEFKEINGS